MQENFVTFVFFVHTNLGGGWWEGGAVL